MYVITNVTVGRTDRWTDAITQQCRRYHATNVRAKRGKNIRHMKHCKLTLLSAQ